MKRLIPVVLFLFIITGIGAQQDGIFRLGMKGGPLFSFSTGDVDAGIVDKPAFTLGVAGGAVGELVPIPWFSVEFNILYTFASYGAWLTTGDKLTMSYGSIEMPIILKGRIPTGTGAFFLGAGVDLILVIGKVNFKDGSSNQAIALTPDQVFHTSLVVSGGYDWKLNSGSNLSVELRYLRSFSSALETAELRANRFDVLVGWSVNL